MPRARRHDGAPLSATAEPLFPPRQAFVVHFRADSDASDARCEGRVEHVLSGRGAPFRSAGDLLASMRRLLRENGHAADASPAVPQPPPALARRGRRAPSRARTETRTPR